MESDKEVIVEVSCKSAQSELTLTLSALELRRQFDRIGAKMHIEKRDRTRLLRIHGSNLKDAIRICESTLPRRFEIFAYEDSLGPIAAPISDHLIRTIKRLYRECYSNPTC
jgi:hypothetical protein